MRRTILQMVEYAILSSVALGPKSGYDVAGWFERVASHFCSAGYGRVYPALGRFEEEGLVVHETLPSERGPERKVYSITGKGKEALLAWSGEPASEPKTRDEQLVKALSYGFLPPETVLELLRVARELHAEKLAYFRRLERGLEKQRADGGISDDAYIGTRLTLMRGIGVKESYIKWCEEASTLVTSREPLR